MNSKAQKISDHYLREKELGGTYLVPATPPGAVGRFDVVANISRETKIRNTVLREEVDRIIHRAEMAERDIGCVIIDCGAEKNPIYSAAFDRADYAFIVATSDPISFRNIDDIRKEIIHDFKEVDINKMQIIVNRVPTDQLVKRSVTARWRNYRPVGFVPEDPDFQEDYHLNAVNFESGYTAFSVEIVQILKKTLRGRDVSLIPDEIDIWIAPWWEVLITNQLPQRILSSAQFRLRTFLAYLVPSLSMVALLVNGYFYLKTQSLYVTRTEVAVIQGDSKDDAETLMTKLRDGGSFSELAKQYSTERSSGERGGTIKEPVGRGNDLPGFGAVNGLAEALQKTDVGSVYEHPLPMKGKFIIIKPLAKYTGIPTMNQILLGLGCIVFLGVFIRSLIWFFVERVKRKLLIEVDEKGEDKDFLVKLLRGSAENRPVVANPIEGWLKNPAGKDPVEWLKKLVEDEMAKQRGEERLRRFLEEDERQI